MEKKVEVSILCQIYGKLLTKKQFEFIDYYYNNDLSLSEIAENNNITRQAVRDVIKKGEDLPSLEGFEFCGYDLVDGEDEFSTGFGTSSLPNCSFDEIFCFKDLNQ